MTPSIDTNAEWLEAHGLEGFASGTVSGIRTRRYHALLFTATTPPTGRMLLVNGIEAWVETPAGRFALSSQQYPPDIVHPDGMRRREPLARRACRSGRKGAPRCSQGMFRGCASQGPVLQCALYYLLVNTVARLARVLGPSADYLMGLTDDPEPRQCDLVEV